MQPACVLVELCDTLVKVVNLFFIHNIRTGVRDVHRYRSTLIHCSASTLCCLSNASNIHSHGDQRPELRVDRLDLLMHGRPNLVVHWIYVKTPSELSLCS